MRDLDELEDYIEKTGDGQLGIMVEIVKEYGNAIPGLIRDLKAKHVSDQEKHLADIVFSTVHRCKGMEYDAIQLAIDFISEKKIIELKNKLKEENAKAKLLEEINLLYVALTRTRNSIHIHEHLLPDNFPKSERIYIMRSEAQKKLDAAAGKHEDNPELIRNEESVSKQVNSTKKAKHEHLLISKRKYVKKEYVNAGKDDHKS